MNETISTQLNHRTIRQFTDQPVPDDVVATILDVAMRTSSSRCFQHAAFIRVADPEKKKALADIGTQPYIADAPELFVGIVDTRRSARILKEKGLSESPAASADAFREGFTDAVLMIQNMTVACESLGLGAAHLGSVLNDYAKLIEVLELPKYTFPVLGFMFGYPNQEPQLKPRMDVSLRVMTDAYSEPESWLDALKDYDAQMHTYYDLRDANRRVDEFTTQIAGKLVDVPADNSFVLQAKAQGFAL